MKVKKWLDDKEVDFHADLVDLRTNYEIMDIFWNLIYYFNEYHLPYEFILPYEDKTFERDSKKYKSETKKDMKVYKPDSSSSKGRHHKQNESISSISNISV